MSSGGWYRNQHTVCLVFPDQLTQRVDITENFKSVDSDSKFAGIIINKTQGTIAKLGIDLQLASDRTSGTTSTHDESFRLRRVSFRSFGIRPYTKSRAPDKHHAEQHIDGNHGARISVPGQQENEQTKHKHGSNERRRGNIEQITHADIAPPAAQETEMIKHQKFNSDNPRKGVPKQGVGRRVKTNIEAQNKAVVI